MGGVTLELEVLTARGYSRTSYSDGMTKLDQEDPGAGDLVIRFTASLTEEMCIRDRLFGWRRRSSLSCPRR